MGTDVYFHESTDVKFTLESQALFKETHDGDFLSFCKEHGWSTGVDADGTVSSLTCPDGTRHSGTQQFLEEISIFHPTRASLEFEDENGEVGHYRIENGEVELVVYERFNIDWNDPPVELLKRLIRAHVESADADSVRRMVDEEIASSVMEA